MTNKNVLELNKQHVIACQNCVADKNDPREYFQGIQFNPEHNQIMATNAHVMLVIDIDDISKYFDKKSVIKIPKKVPSTADDLLKLNMDTLMLDIGDGVNYQCELVDREPPNYNDILESFKHKEDYVNQPALFNIDYFDKVKTIFKKCEAVKISVQGDGAPMVVKSHYDGCEMTFIIMPLKD